MFRYFRSLWSLKSFWYCCHELICGLKYPSDSRISPTGKEENRVACYGVLSTLGCWGKDVWIIFFMRERFHITLWVDKDLRWNVWKVCSDYTFYHLIEPGNDGTRPVGPIIPGQNKSFPGLANLITGPREAITRS